MCQRDQYPPFEPVPHDWYRPPIPRPPTVCAACGAYQDAAPESCPGPTEPADDDPWRTRADRSPSATETHAAAWHEHQEAHR